MKFSEILIIEDDKDIRTSMCELLQEEGFTVATASNGQEGIQFLKEQGFFPKIILLDLMMPVMDGETFLREVVGTFENFSVPVIIFSASLQFRDNYLVKGFVKKPLDLEDLIRKINTYVRTDVHASL